MLHDNRRVVQYAGELAIADDLGAVLVIALFNACIPLHFADLGTTLSHPAMPGVMLASLLAGVTGFLWLRWLGRDDQGGS